MTTRLIIWRNKNEPGKLYARIVREEVFSLSTPVPDAEILYVAATGTDEWDENTLRCLTVSELQRPERPELTEIEWFETGKVWKF